MAGLPPSRVPETHLVHRAAWLRAAVLGANDGIVSTASLVLGVAAAGGSRAAIVTAGVAGLVAGAMSMAAGEYVSVSSQRDVERADIERERRELAEDPDAELAELAAIYRGRGLSEELSWQVARELTAGDALAVHARDELGIDTEELSNPLQAAWASALSFSVGAAVPLLTISLMPASARVVAAILITLLSLTALGVAGAVIGGAPRVRAAARVTAWGALAMAFTMAIGALVGTAV